jgi:hypothetical protein
MSTRSNAEVDRAIAMALEPLASLPSPQQGDDDRIMAGTTIKSPLGFWYEVCLYDEGDRVRWEPFPFSTDYNAAHAAWARLTEEQKRKVINVMLGSPWPRNTYVHQTRIPSLLISTIDATPRQLCDWILAVVEGSNG